MLQKKILSVLTQEVKSKYVNEFDPENSNIKALTIEGEKIGDKKTKIFGYFGLPEKKTDSKLPAMLLVHGGGGHAYHCWVKQWNDRGYAALAIDTTGFMPTQRNAGCNECDLSCWERKLSGVFFEQGFTAAPTNDGMNIEGKSIDEQWMFHAVTACIKANTFLRQQPEIDPDKIGVIGVSWGGVITSILIGWDNRFAAAIPVYGSAYLPDSKADIMQNFKKDNVKKYWLAENRYDSLKMPVLWFGWNDDCCFSVNSQAISYRHSIKGNENTRLSVVNLMYHSHDRTWVREEPFVYADWLLKGKSAMPEVKDNSCGNKILLEIKRDPDIEIKSASLYYITSKMEYEVYNKFNIQTSSYMKQQWQIVPLKIEGNTAMGELPSEAVGTYKDVVFIKDGKEIVVSTEYIEK